MEPNNRNIVPRYIRKREGEECYQTRTTKKQKERGSRQTAYRACDTTISVVQLVSALCTFAPPTRQPALQFGSDSDTTTSFAGLLGCPQCVALLAPGLPLSELFDEQVLRATTTGGQSTALARHVLCTTFCGAVEGCVGVRRTGPTGPHHHDVLGADETLLAGLGTMLYGHRHGTTSAWAGTPQ